MLGLLPTMADFLDEPFADASILPTYLLSRFTREHVTVALGGDGSDELLAGYPTFTADRLAKLYPLPRVVHERMVVPLVDRLPVSTRTSASTSSSSGSRAPLRCRPRRAMRRGSGRSTQSELVALLTREPGDVLDDQRRIYSAAPSADGLERLIYLYAKTYLQDDILVKVDRASMACSLEVRAPFLDLDLVEFLGRVPPRLKLRRLDTKHLLKRAMSGPPSARNRDTEEEGLRDPDRPVVQERASRRASGGARRGAAEGAGHLRARGGAATAAEHLTGRRDHRKSLWTLFVFQLWHRRWMEGGHRQSADEPRPVATPSAIGPSRP